ncbi:MAG: hypothetical protein ACRCY3_08955 [Sphingorhabdus sp.]
MRRHSLLSLILFFALGVKAIIPAGWMPTGEKAFEIAVCTGVETHIVWLDSKGNLHKQDPSRKSADTSDEEPCAFGGQASVANIATIAPLVVKLAATQQPVIAPSVVTVGQGLAAPPPPSTGPPLQI